MFGGEHGGCFFQFTKNFLVLIKGQYNAISVNDRLHTQRIGAKPKMG
jgi:hypothetical protein